MHWVVTGALVVAGVPAGVAANRYADHIARRPNARRPGALRGRRPAVLVVTPLLLAGCGVAFGTHPRAAVAAGYCAVLVALAAVDAEQRIIPNRLVLPAALVVTAAQSAITPSVEWVVAAFAASLFFFVAALAYPGGMGMGDVKLALLLGGMLGRGVVAALAIAMVSAVLPSIVIIARLGAREGRKTAIPFAPFLALGGVVALFVGRRLVDLYLGSL